eukprot:Nitzschia sp. Nitz4//scaffold7_size249615//21705//23774//NITZ4_001140-RA/size249615-processed-gene-0.326-mRNA-1//-1//CDS//3329558331//756//frame0
MDANAHDEALQNDDQVNVDGEDFLDVDGDGDADADADAGDADADDADGDDAEDRDNGNNNGGAIYGGLVLGQGDGRGDRPSAESPTLLSLYLVCEEALDFAPNHPILRPGVCVKIDLEKSTRLSAVFRRYVEVCNEATEGWKPKVNRADLEFVHSQLLAGSTTPEESALMKDDRIQVRKVRTKERELKAETNRMHREIDRHFFDDLKQLMPDMSTSRTADLILDCQGRLVDERGRNQQVLSSTVKAHSAILTIRCPWFADKIKAARKLAARDYPHKATHGNNVMENERRSGEASNEDSRIISRVESEPRAAVDEDDDDDIAMLPLAGGDAQAKDLPRSEATEIENDEDDDENNQPGSAADSAVGSNSPPIVPSESLNVATKSLLKVAITNHSPEAVKLLLEYCYTNRVASLGYYAFVRACKSKPERNSGPLSPIATMKGDELHPTVSFSVAVAGIVLAEEAGLPRLTLMCETAAAHLMKAPSDVMEALCLCTTQKLKSGVDLKFLREAAMGTILRNGVRGVSEFGNSRSFSRAVQDRPGVMVPALIQGISEAYTKRGAKRQHKEVTELGFDDLDVHDETLRQRERQWHDPPGGAPMYQVPSSTETGCNSEKLQQIQKKLGELKAPALIGMDTDDAEEFESLHRMKLKWDVSLPETLDWRMSIPE